MKAEKLTKDEYCEKFQNSEQEYTAYLLGYSHAELDEVNKQLKKIRRELDELRKNNIH